MDQTIQENDVFTKPFSVLHVDGDMLILKILKKNFIGERFQLDSAPSCGEAFLFLEQNNHSYDIVITEMHMYHANGYEIVNRIFQTMPDTTVIVTSNISLERYKQIVKA